MTTTIALVTVANKGIGLEVARQLGARGATVLAHRARGHRRRLGTSSGTALYAKELRDTAVKVNAANSGYTKTDLNGNTGYRSAAEGAEPIVELATVGADGPSGILWGHVASSAAAHSPYAPLPW
jgi:NAD(P)-dependent dehydrogenase (short-subunit alcohol dehydrogenase family)